VIGRVVVADSKLDPELVLAQMPILPEGDFAGEVGDLQRPLWFRGDGYADLEVPLKGRSGEVVDVGTVTLKPLAKDQSATIKGSIHLDSPKEGELPTVRVSLMVPPANTPHNGYSPRRRWPSPVAVPVGKNGEFQASGLNPSEYYLVIEARGHTANNRRVTLHAGSVEDLGTIALRSADLGFYIGAADPKSGPLAWEKDYTSALKKAAEEKKPLMVMMTATWCGPCKMLEKETLDDPWVRSFLSGFVIVKAYEDKAVEEKYGLNGYPTLVFTDGTGKEAHRTVGHQPTLTFSGVLVQAFRKLDRPLPAELQKLVDRKVIPTRP
jgi:thiol-disulfide isomerase/thioredoxin